MTQLKLGSKGPAVRELQQNLTRVGYALPRFGADGDLGFETLDAVDAFAEYAGGFGDDATPNDTIPAALLAAIASAHPEKPPPRAAAREPAEIVPGFVDARPWYNGKDFQNRNPWARIDTICLHQMAVNGNAGWGRWKGLAIHVAVPTKGPAALFNDLDKRVAHGHGWNGRSVGFEVEGHFAGIEGKPHTHWKPPGATGSRAIPMELSVLQTTNARAAIRWCVEQVNSRGGHVKYIGAHRQSYGRKSSDPGELIWKNIALPMMEELGLTTGPTLAHPKYPGLPIPEAWDPKQKGVKY